MKRTRFDYSLLLIYLSGKRSCYSIAIGLGWLLKQGYTI